MEKKKNYKWCNPRRATQTAWRRLILSKFPKFSGYVRQFNFIYVLRESRAFPVLILTRPTTRPTAMCADILHEHNVAQVGKHSYIQKFVYAPAWSSTALRVHLSWHLLSLRKYLRTCPTPMLPKSDERYRKFRTISFIPLSKVRLSTTLTLTTLTAALQTSNAEFGPNRSWNTESTVQIHLFP